MTELEVELADQDNLIHNITRKKMVTLFIN